MKWNFHNLKKNNNNIVIYKIFINNPKYLLFGFKAGDAKKVFFEEGKKVAFKEIRFLGSYTHLHNQYLQLWVDGSIFALILLIAYFCSQLFLHEQKAVDGGLILSKKIILMGLIFILH